MPYRYKDTKNNRCSGRVGMTDEEYNTFISPISDRELEHVFYSSPNGKIDGWYVGTFRLEGTKNIRHGRGIMCFNNGERYHGDWVDDKMCGFGIYHYKNGGNYTGDWVDNKKNGRGTYSCKEEGIRYEGVFKDDKIKRGRLLFNNGTRFEGNINDNLLNSPGTFIYANGNRYVGEFKVDDNDGYRCVKHGHGVMYYVNGSHYEGEWKDDKRHGRGKEFKTDGGHYEGGWEDGKRHGRGKVFYANGSSEEGYWYDGNKVDTTRIKDSRRDVDDRVKKLVYKLYETQSTKEICAICFDEIERADFEIRKCGHVFHDDCWTEYKMSKLFADDDVTCPCCRF